MQFFKNNIKTYLILLIIVLFFSLLLSTMYFYYNRYINSLTTNTVVGTNNNTPLLPTFTGDNNSETNSNNASEGLEIKEGVLGNLNKIETFANDAEILSSAKTVEIETRPITNYILLNKKLNASSSKQTIVRYVNKKEGDIVDYDLITGQKTTLQTSKISNVGDAHFSKDGNFVVLRNEDRGGIVSKLIDIPTATTYLLDPNIASLDFLDNNNIIYGTVKDNGYSVKLLDIKTKKPKEIAVLQMTEWSLENMGGNSVRATFKPTGYAEGISLVIDTRVGTIKNDIKPITGLVTKKTTDNKFLLLSEGGVGYNKLLFMNRGNQSIFSLNSNTFLEKCAREVVKGGIVCAVPEKLDRQSVYPDTWYKNILNTRDKLIYKSLTSTSSKLVYNFEGKNVSVNNLTIGSLGIFFQDTETGGLYTIR